MAHLMRCLVVDEHLSVGQHEFRVRVWYARLNKPICVLSQVPGGVAPDVVSGRLANLVLQRILGFREPWPTFYETSMLDGRTRCFRVVYQSFGSAQRPYLGKPAYQPISVPDFQRSLLISTGSDQIL